MVCSDGFLFNATVAQVDIDDQTLSILTMGIENCGETVLKPTPFLHSYDLSGSPFLFSRKHNVVQVGGCGGGAVMVDRNDQIVAGCAAVCSNGTEVTKNCYGMGCCKTTIPVSLDCYAFKFLGLKVKADVSDCTIALLIDSSLIINKSIAPKLEKLDSQRTMLKWSVSDLPVQSLSYTNSTCNYKFSSADDGGGYVCRCKADFYQGNPYLPYGCQVVKECNGCIQDCINLGNSTYGCPDNSKFVVRIQNGSMKGTAIALGVGTSIGFVLLLLGAYCSYHLIRRRRDIRLKEKYFERNSGLILKQQMSSEGSNTESIRVFTADDLVKAVDWYNEARILGQGGQGTVYKGMLSDGKIVAIKISK